MIWDPKNDIAQEDENKKDDLPEQFAKNLRNAPGIKNVSVTGATRTSKIKSDGISQQNARPQSKNISPKKERGEDAKKDDQEEAEEGLEEAPQEHDNDSSKNTGKGQGSDTDNNQKDAGTRQDSLAPDEGAKPAQTDDEQKGLKEEPRGQEEEPDEESEKNPDNDKDEEKEADKKNELEEKKEGESDDDKDKGESEKEKGDSNPKNADEDEEKKSEEQEGSEKEKEGEGEKAGPEETSPTEKEQSPKQSPQSEAPQKPPLEGGSPIAGSPGGPGSPQGGGGMPGAGGAGAGASGGAGGGAAGSAGAGAAAGAEAGAGAGAAGGPAAPATVPAGAVGGAAAGAAIGGAKAGAQKASEAGKEAASKASQGSGGEGEGDGPFYNEDGEESGDKAESGEQEGSPKEAPEPKVTEPIFYFGFVIYSIIDILKIIATILIIAFGAGIAIDFIISGLILGPAFFITLWWLKKQKIDTTAFSFLNLVNCVPMANFIPWSVIAWVVVSIADHSPTVQKGVHKAAEAQKMAKPQGGGGGSPAKPGGSSGGAPSAGGASAGGGIKACWIAEAVFGVHDPRTHLLRWYLNAVWDKTLFGKPVMFLYRTYGKSFAPYVARSKALTSFFRLLFVRVIPYAVKYNKNDILI